MYFDCNGEGIRVLLRKKCKRKLLCIFGNVFVREIGDYIIKIKYI